MKTRSWKSLNRHIGGVVVSAFVGLMAPACNTVLDTDSFRTAGCPSAGAVDCLDATTPRVCGTNGQWEKQPACVNQTCNAGICGGVCAPGKRCTGNVPENCDKGQWLADAECVNKTCFEGACTGVCTAGAKDCAVNGVPEICGADGQWIEGVACVGQTCNAGNCVGVCAPGNRCAGNTVQDCKENGQWTNAEACTAPKHCEAGECVVECTTGDLRCVGNSPEVCDASGAWTSGPTCVGQTCDLGQCTGNCGPHDATCFDPKTPQTCDQHGQLQKRTVCIGDCFEGSCPGPSCNSLPDACGPNGNENCCLSPQVLGGTFNRGNDPAYPATVSDFRLDRFEVTVGRFRRFMNSGPNTPQPEDGAHPLIPGSGWDPLWNQDLIAGLTVVKIPGCSTYTNTPGSNEVLPINCVNWYVAFAFCAWDGGRVPTEAEWHYAASGGDEQRIYPWGVSEPTYALAVYDAHDGIPRVGSKSPQGDNKFGHADMAGSMWEWTLDVRVEYPMPCINCAQLPPPYSENVARGGTWNYYASPLLNVHRAIFYASFADQGTGFRCARSL